MSYDDSENIPTYQSSNSYEDDLSWDDYNNSDNTESASIDSQIYQLSNYYA